MKLTVVGCSGSFPGPDSAASCYLVEADGFRLVLDLGNGSLGALQRHTDIYAVGAVLLSHTHPDHFLDLCSYYVARAYRPGGSPAPIPVHGPGDTRDRLAAAAGEDAAYERVFSFRRWEREQRIGPFTVTTARVAHPVEAYGMRIEHGGRVLAYSGDSAPCDALVELARDADLLLAEASFRDADANPAGVHMTAREAGTLATEAGVGRLVVTHVPPWHDGTAQVAAARSSFAGLVVGARPGQTHAFGDR